jgi:hypothetical protein
MAKGNSQINVAIALDTAPLEAGQKRAIRQFDKIGSVGQRASGGLKTLGKGMAKVGLLAGAMAGTVGVVANKMVQLASDSEESANAFGVTFKEASQGLNQFVDEFSTKAGFTTAELQQLLSFTGGVVNGMGASAEASAEFSKQVAVLSGDIGSLRNIDPSDVLDRITKSLTGEREGLKQLGIVINQTELDQKALTMTNKNAVSELTAMDRATATLTLIQERSADAIGDLDNTSDGFANTQRRLKAELRETATAMGESLMPSVNAVLPLISEMASDILPKMAKAFANGVEKVKEFNKQFGEEITSRLKKSFQFMKDGITIIGHFIGKFVEMISNSKILSAIFGELDKAQGGLMDAVNNYAESIRESNAEEKRAVRSREDMIKKYTKTETVLNKTQMAQFRFTQEMRESTEAVEDHTDEIVYGAVEFQKYTGSINKALSSIKTLTGLQERGKREQERLDEATGELEESNIQVAKAQQVLAKSQDEVTRLQADGTEVTADEELAIIQLKKSIEELTEAQDGSREKELELILAKEELIELEKEATAQSDAYFDAVRSVEQAEEDLADAIEDQKQAREDQIKAKNDLAEATKISAQNLLTEALAVKELEKAFGSFEAGTFKKTLEEIATLTGRKIAEIEQAFANAGLTESSFTAPDSGSSAGSTPPVATPTFAESNSNETGNVGTGSGGNGGAGGSVAQPVKIYTTLNIGSERFETVTQDAIINLQKQGKRVLI